MVLRASCIFVHFTEPESDSISSSGACLFHLLHGAAFDRGVEWRHGGHLQQWLELEAGADLCDGGAGRAPCPAQPWQSARPGPARATQGTVPRDEGTEGAEPSSGPALRTLRACPPQRLPPPEQPPRPDPRPSPARLPTRLLESQSKVQASGRELSRQVFPPGLSGQGGVRRGWVNHGPWDHLSPWMRGGVQNGGQGGGGGTCWSHPVGPRLERGGPKVTEKHLEWHPGAGD